MKATIKVKKGVYLEFVLIDVPVRYDDEDIPYDFPLRYKVADIQHEHGTKYRNDHDRWVATINIDSGKILDWPIGKSGSVEMKVCDEGVYTLLDSDKRKVLEISYDYVPNKLIPERDGYGDYIKLCIDENGIITNWYKNPSIEEFIYSE